MRQRCLAALAGVVVGAAALGGGSLWSSNAEASGIDFTGRRAPELYVARGLQGVSSGTTLASYAGKVLVLKFFFAGCPTCRASLPEFEALSRRYAGRSDVRFLALAYDTADNIVPLVRANGYTFPVGLDPSGVTARAYGIETYPTNYVIGADGYVKAYDNMSSWVIDREAAATPIVPVESLRDRNIKELGDVPAALAAVKDAAGNNDYGQVLRIVEAHLDATKDTADVVAAAGRIRAIVSVRFLKRSEKIVAKWGTGDHAGAWRMIQSFEDDFKGTSFAPQLAAWIAKFPEPRPVAAR